MNNVSTVEWNAMPFTIPISRILAREFPQMFTSRTRFGNKLKKKIITVEGKNAEIAIPIGF